MIVGSYVLHLYCAAECTMQRERANNFRVGGGGASRGEFSAPNERAARGDARKAGWIFAEGEAWCSEACRALVDGREVTK